MNDVMKDCEDKVKIDKLFEIFERDAISVLANELRE